MWIRARRLANRKICGKAVQSKQSFLFLNGKLKVSAERLLQFKVSKILYFLAGLLQMSGESGKFAAKLVARFAQEKFYFPQRSFFGWSILDILYFSIVKTYFFLAE